MKPTPRCPNCPEGNNHGIILSKMKLAWYCTVCCKYYKQIGGIYPTETVMDLIKTEETPELRWTAEEIKQSSDEPVAKFYAGLNDGDRWDLESHHIDIHGDLRETEIAPKKAYEPYEGTK